jgi:hypothetical protein
MNDRTVYAGDGTTTNPVPVAAVVIDCVLDTHLSETLAILAHTKARIRAGINVRTKYTDGASPSPLSNWSNLLEIKELSILMRQGLYWPRACDT